MADGAEKNLQEKFRSHQLVLMLTGDFLFNKDLQINFSIWYLIWWAASPTPPAGSISAAGWLERSHGKRTCSHTVHSHVLLALGSTVMGNEVRAKWWKIALLSYVVCAEAQMGLGLWAQVHKQHKRLHLSGDTISSGYLQLLFTDTWGARHKLWAERKAEGQKRQEK